MHYLLYIFFYFFFSISLVFATDEQAIIKKGAVTDRPSSLESFSNSRVPSLTTLCCNKVSTVFSKQLITTPLKKVSGFDSLKNVPEHFRIKIGSNILKNTFLRGQHFQRQAIFDYCYMNLLDDEKDDSSKARFEKAFPPSYMISLIKEHIAKNKKSEESCKRSLFAILREISSLSESYYFEVINGLLLGDENDIPKAYKETIYSLLPNIESMAPYFDIFKKYKMKKEIEEDMHTISFGEMLNQE